MFVVVFNPDKEQAVEDKCRRHYWCRHKMFFHVLIESQSNYGRRYAGHDNLTPKTYRITFFLPRFPTGPGIELFKVQGHNCEDCPELNYHQEHIHEILADVELDKFVHQNHMAGTGYRQPFRQAFYDTENHYFQQFHYA